MILQQQGILKQLMTRNCADVYVRILEPALRKKGESQYFRPKIAKITRFFHECSQEADTSDFSSDAVEQIASQMKMKSAKTSWVT